MSDELNDRRIQLGPLRCGGEWIMPGWDRTFNVWCRCYWLCRPCNYHVIWSGNQYNLPTTNGQMIYQGGGGLKNGDTCLCPKPGPDRNFQNRK